MVVAALRTASSRFVMISLLSRRRIIGVSVVVVSLFLALSLRAAEPPTEWIDSDTGHRVVRLSREPGTASLYFHQNAYTPDGKKLIVTTPTGISTIDLRTHEIEPVISEKVNVLVVGRKTGQLYYLKRENGVSAIFALRLDTKESRKVATLPAGAYVSSLNADETLLLGAITENRPAAGAAGPEGAPRPDQNRPPGDTTPLPEVKGPSGQKLTFAEQKEVRLNTRLEQKIPMSIFTLDTKTGAMKTVHQSTDWLNHLQFSPADPARILFCHEGPWHKVDRVWTILADGSGLTLLHARTMNMEIAGHEFFSPDGKTVWYDLQTPRGEDFWVAGRNLETGTRTWYHLDRDQWSVHYNVSVDGSFFAGDGGDSEMVAHAPNGKWIWLFRPEGIPDVAGIHAENAKHLINSGVLRAERLVNMAQHDYRLEPNVTFTPDMKWIVFRSNMHGATHVYAVEIAKAAK